MCLHEWSPIGAWLTRDLSEFWFRCGVCAAVVLRREWHNYFDLSSWRTEVEQARSSAVALAQADFVHFETWFFSDELPITCRAWEHRQRMVAASCVVAPVRVELAA